ALLSAAVIQSTALAQSTLNYTNGDIFIGFRSTDGTQNYIIDIGQASQFTSGTSFTLSLGNVGADLAAVFGSNWLTRIDSGTGNTALLWSVFGAIQGVAVGSDPRSTLYTSNTFGGAGFEFLRASQASQNNTATTISNVSNLFQGQTSTVNSPFGFIAANA